MALDQPMSMAITRLLPSRSIEFYVPGLPVAFARTGRNGKFSFTPKKQRSYMSILKDLAYEAMGDRDPFDVPLHIEMAISYTWPTSWSKKKRENPWKASRPDLDNLMKLVCDAVNGIVWTDDALVCRASIEKFYDNKAGTRVTVTPLNFLRS